MIGESLSRFFERPSVLTDNRPGRVG